LDRRGERCQSPTGGGPGHAALARTGDRREGPGVNALHAHLLEAVRHAPSLLNTQPWRVRFDGLGMTLLLNPPRLLPALAPDNRAAWLALGAAAENACLALEQLGLEGSCAVSETVTLTWTPRPGPASNPGLYQMVPLRRTSRLPFGPAEAPAAEGVIWLGD